MDILKELESLDFDASIYTEKLIRNCSHGEKVALSGVLRITQKKTQKGAPYYVLNISDSTGSINCMAWNETPLFKLLTVSDSGKSVKVYGVVNVGTYTNIEIKQLQLIEETKEEIEEKELKTRGEDLSINNLRKELTDTVNKIISPFLKDIVTEALASVDEVLDNTPFSEKTAYNYKGGLIHSIIDFCSLVSSVSESINCGFYSQSTVLNEDLLISGAILSNLGKTRTLKIENGTVEKTFEGMLDEDSIFSREITRAAIEKVYEKLSEEDKSVYDKISKELLHMVSSVKGNMNYGASSVPRSKHAIILSHINNIMYTKGLFENLENSEDKEFTRAYDAGKSYYLGSTSE